MAVIETARRSPAPVKPWTPARFYALLLIAPGLVLAIFFIWPLAQVAIRSIVEPEIGLGNYARIFGTTTYVRVILNTMTLAATVALVTLVLAYPVAWMVSDARGSLLYLFLALILIPFWTSVVIRTFAWMVLFQRRGVLNSFLLSAGLIDQPLRLMHNSIGVHIGMVHILLPFMILPLLSAMRAIDPTVMRAASVLGANPLRQFVHIYLPLTMPGVSAGFLLVFISALGFFITPALLGGPENMTIAVLIEQQTSRLLDWPMASALASLLLAATALLYLLYDRVSRHLGAAGVFGG
jgi:putative spermidine/putrescine transport system permease protein/mannopine transport system permease protein